MATLIGVVSAIVGEVFAVSASGGMRQLQEGSRVFAGEQLLTGAGGSLAIRLTSGEELTLGRDSTLLLDEQLLAEGAAGAPVRAAGPEYAPSAQDLADVEEVQQAIAAGVDPTRDLPPTAAGPGAGAAGGGGGTSFVLLGETAGRVDPTIGYPTGPLAFAPASPEPFVAGLDPDNGVIITGLDGQVSLEGADLQVNEGHLPTGSAPSTATSQSGTFGISAPDGIATLTIAIAGNTFTFTYAQLANSAVVPLEIDSPAGVLVIDGFTGTQQGGTVSFAYTLQDPVMNASDEDQAGESFSVVVVDTDGDSASASLDVLIIDDAPQASDYSGGTFAEGSGAQVIGDAVSLLGISAGADGLAGTLQDIAFSNQGSSGGSLAINAAGELVYTAPSQVDNTAGPVTETFSYTVTDRDGDSVTRTVTFAVSDTGVSNVTATDTLVDEDSLAGGNPGGPGDDTPNANGTISYQLGADDVQSITLSVGTDGNTGLTTLDGTPVVAQWDAASNTLTGYAGSTAVFTLVVSAITNSGAAYSVTLLQPLMHATPEAGTAHEDNLSLDVNVRVTDSDGSTGTGSFSVSIDDDSPLLGDFTAATLPNQVGTVNGFFTVQPGADGLAGFNITPPDIAGLDYETEDSFAGDGSFLATTLTAWAEGADRMLDQPVFILEVRADGTYLFNLVTPDAAVQEQISLLNLSPGGPKAFVETADGRVEFSTTSTKGINSSTQGFGVDNQFFGVGESFTMEFHYPGETGDQNPASNAQLVDKVTLVNDSINGSLTITWTATNTLTGATQSGTVTVSGAATVIDPSISFNQLYLVGSSGSGQGVRLTSMTVETTILPADQTYGFQVAAVDGDGDWTANALLNVSVVGGAMTAYTLVGTAADDVLAASSVTDQIAGAAGYDIVDYSDDTAGVTVDLSSGVGSGGSAEGDTYSSIEGVLGGAGNDTLIGDGGDNYLDGGAGNDVLFGAAGNDRLIGGAGDDTLYGGDGDDLLEGGAGNDVLYGDAGNDTLYGGEGDDVLHGGASNDALYGGGGLDTLIGGEGDDLLVGGEGDDLLTGGAGSDTFVWNAGETGIDTITDFEIGVDRLDLADILIGESGDAESIGNLLEHIAISTEGSDTVIRLSADGVFEPGVLPTDDAVDQTIILQGVDLLGEYGGNVEAAILGMLDDGSLSVDK